MTLAVIKDVTTNPGNPKTIMNTKIIASLVLSEMKQYNIPMKYFGSALQVNSATFSLAVRDPRCWSDTNEGQKRIYYFLYLWLNLPQKFRKSTFQFDIGDNDTEDNKEEFIPKVNSLISVVSKELLKHQLDLKNLAHMVLNMDSIVLRNMLVTPLPWDMTSWRMKRKFGKLWYWLKQKQDIRLTMVGIKPEFDTLMIATEVLQRVDQYTLNSLVTDINKGLPVDVVKSLLRYPISWHMASQHEKFIYLSLTQWLCKKYVEREIRDLDIDTREVCSESLAFIKEHGITIGISQPHKNMKISREIKVTLFFLAQFAAKVAHIPRANVSLYFNSPPRWSKANFPLKHALINVCFWLDLDTNDRLQVLQIKEEHSEDKQTTPYEESFEDLNTYEISQKMKVKLRSTGQTIKNFAKMVSVNRNYFANLVNSPVEWSKTTTLQRKVYKFMLDWLQNKVQDHPGVDPEPARMALKPINGPVKTTEMKAKRKQERVRFSDQQRKYLIEAFERNPRPSQAERLVMSKHLGVNMRTIVIFFSNRRSRVFPTNSHENTQNTAVVNE